MVDLNTSSPATPAREDSKIKSFMGRTSGIGLLKSKFLTVLGNSNELLSGISNKLTLSISSSDSDYCDDDEEVPKFDETIDYTKIDFEFRRIKSRRAHEELVSGRYRYPNLNPNHRLEVKRISSRSTSSSTSSSSSSQSLTTNLIDKSQVSSSTRSNSIDSRNSGGYDRGGHAIAGARRSDLDLQKDLLKLNDVMKTDSCTPNIDVKSSPNWEPSLQPSNDSRVDNLAKVVNTPSNTVLIPLRSKASNSSTMTSLRDDPDVPTSPSIDTSDWQHFIRSESQNSVPSCASSISLDCRESEHPVKEFMKKCTDLLFSNALAVDMELKSEFGSLTRLELGRQWFVHYLLQQKSKSKRLNDTTFLSMVQFFTISLFECCESEDYLRAAVIMNMCFLFYREIEVPGCDPYYEYLFIFMRKQPLWLKLAFWNAAFYDAIKNERDHRLKSMTKKTKRRQKKENIGVAEGKMDALNLAKTVPEEQSIISTDASSSGSTRKGRDKTSRSFNADIDCDQLNDILTQETVLFRQLGAFTCNMHSLGVPQVLCLEFLRKQLSIFNLPKEKSKLLKDSIHRMYHETDLWGLSDL